MFCLVATVAEDLAVEQAAVTSVTPVMQLEVALAVTPLATKLAAKQGAVTDRRGEF